MLDIVTWCHEMESNDDVGVDVRRNRRRVRVRKAPKTTGTSSTADDAVVTNNNADLSAGAETSVVEPSRQDDSTDPLASAGVPDQRTQATTINGDINDSEQTAKPRSDVADNEDFGLQPLTGTDDAVLDDGGHPPLDDRSSRPLPGASTKSRGKRRAKNKDRKPAAVTKDLVTDQQLNGHDVSGDWFTAVRSADIATVRRLAQSRVIDVNATDEVSRINNKRRTLACITVLVTLPCTPGKKVTGKLMEKK